MIRPPSTPRAPPGYASWKLPSAPNPPCKPLPTHTRAHTRARTHAHTHTHTHTHTRAHKTKHAASGRFPTKRRWLLLRGHCGWYTTQVVRLVVAAAAVVVRGPGSPCSARPVSQFNSAQCGCVPCPALPIAPLLSMTLPEHDGNLKHSLNGPTGT